MLFLPGCIRDVEPPLDDMYMSFPQAEILGASFYLEDQNNKAITGDEAGTINVNEDGTYTVRMRRRPKSLPAAMFITGSFEFSEFYKIVCEFPDDPSVANKPYRVYACASVGMDGNVDADYPTARDLGDADFRDGVAIGTFEMSNEGINTLNKDPSGRGRPYITVFLYLYFHQPSTFQYATYDEDPEDWYEFTLMGVKGANGVVPASRVTRAEVYRGGDAAGKFVLESVFEEDELGEQYIVDPILARFNYRFDSRKMDSPVTVMDTPSLNIDLKVPDGDLGREIEFELRNAGLYSGSTANSITAEMIMSAGVLAGTSGGGQSGIVTEIRTPGNPPTFHYVVKARTVWYADLFGAAGAGLRLAIPGTAGAFDGTDRFTCTLYLPDKYVGE
ncbi:MAG: hypothetical protein FWH38_00815 [Treponema sp.]|nr:hypothetical protein [Treponema sp.]